MTSARHYLDYNATCPVKPPVIDTVAKTMAMVGNSSSVHAEGRAARQVVENAREKVRALVNAPMNGVIFTSGGTEAIHYALNGLVRRGDVSRVFVSAIEHAAVPSNAGVCGAAIEIIPALRSGVADLDWLRDRLSRYEVSRDGGFLVCLMLANNETGVIQPVSEAAEIAHERGGLLFADAIQAVGKVPVNFVMSGADLLAISGHKFGGPIGVGALIAGPNLPLEPVLRGGGHESNRRAGTHNAPAIAGFGVACELAPETIERAGEIAGMRNRLQDAALAEGAVIWGADAERLPGTLSLSAPGFGSQTQLMTMDLAGIAISSGSACSSGKSKPSHVLNAMGVGDDLAECGVRISIGWGTVEGDIAAFCHEWPASYARVKGRAA